MFLSALLTEKGFTPERIYTTAAVRLGAGLQIKTIDLVCEAAVPAIALKASLAG
ncbi:MAG: hypothetical protein JW990_18780 [Thermoleophilia bacterium]|nr:hypothetical protein [Thermoleophilia bacterium]